MQKQTILLLGIGMIFIGLMGLVSNLLFPIIGVPIALWIASQIWPLAVIGLGMAFMLVPLLTRKRALGVLFIPGTVILANGGLLGFANMTGYWDVWSTMWPLEILSLALGFLLAAIFMRTIWLTLPAIILGLNGIVLMFCALTGWWDIWSLLWTIEPLAVGLCLLVIGLAKKSNPVTVIGLLFCGFAGAAFTFMGLIFISDWWMFRFAGPVAVIIAGALLLLWALIHPQSFNAQLRDKFPGQSAP